MRFSDRIVSLGVCGEATARVKEREFHVLRNLNGMIYFTRYSSFGSQIVNQAYIYADKAWFAWDYVVAKQGKGFVVNKF